MEKIYNYKKAIAYKCCWNCDHCKDHKYCIKAEKEIDPNYTCDAFSTHF